MIRYIIEVIALIPLLLILYALKIDLSSNLMGKIMRGIGPYLAASRIAERNLQQHLPNLSYQHRGEVIAAVWENIGRIIGEMLHWPYLSKEEFEARVKVIDHSNGTFFHPQAALVLSGHYGNWEIYPWLFKWRGINHTMVYRHANNPVVDWFIKRMRMKAGGDMVIKGISGMREVVNALKNSRHVGMLIDQKTNNGIMAPLFGRMAPTTPAPANIAIKWGYPIFMTRVIRTKGANYQVEILPVMEVPEKATAIEIMTMVNKCMEGWIKEYPEQWFWVHRRWGKD